MQRKHKLVYIGIVLVLLIVFAIINLFIPRVEISLNGKSNMNIEVGSEYKELGANAYVASAFKKDKLNLEIDGNVDSSKLGNYIITYKVNNHGNIITAQRKVKVIDDIKPVITLNSDVKACKKNRLVEIDATVTDNYDGDITDNLEYRIDFDKVYISAKDSSLNKSEIVEDLKYIDEEEPVIKLNGNDKIYLVMGESYNELGAEATDSCDGNLTDKINITNNVNINKEGSYEVVYEVTDNSNKTSTIKRTVVVTKPVVKEEEKATGTIYLTFDDGPGVYTEEILNILNRYNVKATFFVTNQFPKYNYLIKKEYDEGHSIGIHTYSHKWNIYESEETYLNDFNNMDNIIYNLIGIHTKIFRFPGGSSNTVSRNYNIGIMSRLASIMTEKGYVYFDWTFDSGDTSKNKNKASDIINTFKTYLNKHGDNIVLMHDIKKSTLEALPSVLEYTKNLGYTFKVITENTTPKQFKIAN